MGVEGDGGVTGEGRKRRRRIDGRDGGIMKGTLLRACDCVDLLIEIFLLH